MAFSLIRDCSNRCRDVPTPLFQSLIFIQKTFPRNSRGPQNSEGNVKNFADSPPYITFEKVLSSFSVQVVTQPFSFFYLGEGGPPCLYSLKKNQLENHPCQERLHLPHSQKQEPSSQGYRPAQALWVGPLPHPAARASRGLGL